jgi:tRNA threonylcarbamoyl adenosine modification protein (Sua5/YciO/YrdC/YwlC family)
METAVLTIDESSGDDPQIRVAARAIAAGHLVVFPTETVYGVGTSAVNRDAVDALNRLKQRPQDKPFTLHLADPGEAEPYAGTLSPVAQRLIRKAWPGPLTLVVPDRRTAAGKPGDLVEDSLYYEHTVGLRCPDHVVGRAILREAGVPVVGTSANLAGHAPPRRAAEALADLGGKVHLVVDSGPTRCALASTVVRIRPDDSYEVLREGAVPASRVARLAVTRILFICTGNQCRSPMAVGIARQVLAQRLGCAPDQLQARGIEVLSAGTATGGGYPATPNAIRAMAEKGIDIRDHRSRAMTVDLLRSADYIWVMSQGHRSDAAALVRSAGLPLALVDPTGREVSDPVGGDLEQYRACARHIEAALARRLTEIV